MGEEINQVAAFPVDAIRRSTQYVASKLTLHTPDGEDLRNLERLPIIVQLFGPSKVGRIFSLFQDRVGGQEMLDADDSANGGDVLGPHEC